MKNYKEFMEAVLAGETLYKIGTGLKMKLSPSNGNLIIQSEQFGAWIDSTGYTATSYQDWAILPKTININGIEVPEPVRNNIVPNQKYYLVSLDTDDVRVQQWDNSYYDHMWLNCGLIHLTKEAATIHRDALLSFTVK